MAAKFSSWLVVGGAAFFLLVLLSNPAAAMITTGGDIFLAAEDLIAGFETFSPIPYWDKKRWSWGYGTPAPGSTGLISEADARTAMSQHIEQDFQRLQPQLSRELSLNQWAAYLSFSYNEGVGSAENLIVDINAGDDSVLETHWKKYIYAGGVVNDTLVQRRDKEWQLWVS